MSTDHDFLATLFPSQPRDFPFRRGLRTTLRGAHIVATGVLLGGHIFEQPKDALLPWLGASILTGLSLFLTDLYASFGVLCELRGLLVLAKLLPVALAGVFWDARVPLLIVALFAGAVGSHLPREFRHRVLFLRGRVVPDDRRG